MVLSVPKELQVCSKGDVRIYRSEKGENWKSGEANHLRQTAAEIDVLSL